MDDPDEALARRLREKLNMADGSTEQKMDGHDGDDEDDEDDDTEAEAVNEEVTEAAQMIAEASAEEITPEQVMEMLSPLFGEDTRDDPSEMAAEADEEDGDEAEGDDTEAEADTEAAAAGAGLSESEVREVAAEAAEEAVPDDLVTGEDLDAKLDHVVDALASETRDVLQKAEVGSTPAPASGGGDRTVTKDDLFSDTAGADGASDEAEGEAAD